MNFETFSELFVGRRDVVPERWKSGKGYSPICRKRFTPDCPKVPCKSCGQADFVPWSEELLSDHFAGRRILGIYPMFDDGRHCRFIAGDFDNHDGQHDPGADVDKISDLCISLDLPFYVFASQSGKGYHGYFFFPKPVLAAKARAVYYALLDRAGVTYVQSAESSTVSSFDRLFPNQDSLQAGSFGNLIALPLIGLNRSLMKGIHAEDQEDALAEVETLDDLDGILTEWGVKVAQPATLSVKTPCDKVTDNCLFLSHCRDDAETLTEPEWHTMISLLVREPGGPALIHGLSEKYPGYTRAETDAKIISVLNSQEGNLTCKFVRSVWDCKSDCGVSHVRDSLGIKKIDPDFEENLLKCLAKIPAIDDDSAHVLEMMKKHEPERYERLRPKLPEVVKVPEKKSGLPFCFWYDDVDKKGNPKLKISSDGIVAELEKMGVRNVELPEGTTLAIIRDNVIEIASIAKIRNKLLNEWFDLLPEKISKYHTKPQLKELLRASIGRVLAESICDTFRIEEIRQIRDTKEQVHLFFANGFATVTQTERKLRPYAEMDGHIFKDTVADRDYAETVERPDDFVDFCKKVTGDDPDRLQALQSVIGRNISRYNDPSYPKCVVWMEDTLAHNDEPSGGTGKVLLAQCHRTLRKIKVINAGRVKTDGTFAMQGVTTDTQGIILDEVSAKFDLSLFFADISGGLTVEEKRQKSWTFGYEDNPRMQIVTNHAVNGDSASFARRVHEVVLSSYFSDERTPYDEYGRLFYDDWSDSEWQGFHQFLIDCIQVFLANNGRMIASQSVPARLKKCVNTVGREFFEFGQGLARNEEIKSEMAYEEFLATLSRKEAASMSKNRFGRLMTRYCKLAGIVLEKKTYAHMGKTKFYYILIEETANDGRDNTE